MATLKIETEIEVPPNFLTYDLASGVFKCGKCGPGARDGSRSWLPGQRGGSFESAREAFITAHTKCVYVAAQEQRIRDAQPGPCRNDYKAGYECGRGAEGHPGPCGPGSV